MGASDIARHAVSSGVDIIGIADHNTCCNFPGVSDAAKALGKGLVVLPCIEVQSMEDVHVLCVFEAYETVLGFKDWLWQRIMPIKNNPDHFGLQLIVDASDNIIGEEETLLIQGVGYEVDQIVDKSQELGGLAILAHVDRPAFSYPAALGPMQQDYPADAFELSCRLNYDEADKWRKEYPERTFIRSSDSHMLSGISRSNCTKMTLLEPTFSEIKKALKNEDGRRISWPWG